MWLKFPWRRLNVSSMDEIVHPIEFSTTRLFCFDSIYSTSSRSYDQLNQRFFWSSINRAFRLVIKGGAKYASLLETKKGGLPENFRQIPAKHGTSFRDERINWVKGNTTTRIHECTQWFFKSCYGPLCFVLVVFSNVSCKVVVVKNSIN